jgi:hypothetical protein
LAVGRELAAGLLADHEPARRGVPDREEVADEGIAADDGVRRAVTVEVAGRLAVAGSFGIDDLTAERHDTGRGGGGRLRRVRGRR